MTARATSGPGGPSTALRGTGSAVGATAAVAATASEAAAPVSGASGAADAPPGPVVAARCTVPGPVAGAVRSGAGSRVGSGDVSSGSVPYGLRARSRRGPPVL
ncbi:hypothetical protein ACIQKB_13395 [Streptomyces sp. NPDC092046]|uniref:hypothetical protein n=1 Tax=Streptomyces sp. NPDC092046 TaxID=3366009 RepID=UPI0037F710B2